MCGVGLMKSSRLGEGAVRDEVDQNWRLSWNCSLIVTRLGGVDEPSAFSGM